MGSGIAHCFAQYGFDVHLVDLNEDALKTAIEKIGKNLDRQVNKGLLTAEDKAAALGRILPFTDLGVALTSADLVVEAATENQDLKAKIFQQMDAAAPAHCILATNTSSLSITTLASYTQRPEKVIGMHFMNPVPVMRLVEIIKGYQTDEATLTTIEDLTRTIEKVPLVAADYPGFVANRILLPMINEAIETLFQGVGTVEAIDEMMKLGMGHPMGPLRLADFIGLDVCVCRCLRCFTTVLGKTSMRPAHCCATWSQRATLALKPSAASTITAKIQSNPLHFHFNPCYCIELLLYSMCSSI